MGTTKKTPTKTKVPVQKKTVKKTVKKPAKKTVVIIKEPTKPVGRPISLEDPEIRAKFLQAAGFNMSVEACSAYAKISKQTYYTYIKTHPEFVDEMEQNKQIPYQKAVQAIINNFAKDPHLALKYLERRHKDEFSLRQEITGADGKQLIGGLAGLVSKAKVVLDEHGKSKNK